MLQSLQERYGPSLDIEARSWLSSRSSTRDLYGMMSYQLGHVDASLQPLSTPGGKRFRPILCLLVCEAAGKEWRKALPTGAAIEFLHNFSLIHDDIEDRDPARRHRPTVWKVWGDAQAINTGDGMFALAGRVLMATAVPPAALAALARHFHDTSLALTEGQFLDMQFETRQVVTPAEYLDMIGRKTGALVGFSCQAGAIVGGSSDRSREALHTFGYNLGMAFQIEDDIQGIWGTPGTTGKEAGKDLQNRKKTLPVLVAMERAEPGQKKVLRDFYTRTTDDTDPVMQILDAVGARASSREAVEQQRHRAIDALIGADLTTPYRDLLESLAAELTGQ